MSTEPTDFVRRALELKISRAEIARVLGEAKWPEAEVKAALASFADLPFTIAVPRPRPYLSAREVFTYLVLFGALYASVWYVVALLFAFLDKIIPDPVHTDYAATYVDDSIRWSIAGLVVSAPLFLYMFRIVSLRIARDPTARESRPRKWLTYVTLALTVCALAGDVAGIIYLTLSGDLTMIVLLKAVILALVAGGTFVYFYHDVRQGEDA